MIDLFMKSFITTTILALTILFAMANGINSSIGNIPIFAGILLFILNVYVPATILDMFITAWRE